jgi:hypothetical protein
MTTMKETKKAVQEAAERLEEARQNAQRIVDAMAVQPSVFDAQLLAKARERLVDMSACVMLGEASREALEEARREASDLEIEAAAAEFNARQIAEGRAGLERRLSEAQGVIEDAEQDLIEATGEWLKAELAAADEAYTAAAQRAADAFAHVKTIGAMLDHRKACPPATSCSVDMRLPVIGPVSLAESAAVVGGGIRGVVATYTTKQWMSAHNHLLTEFKSLGALWPVRRDR